ncbi:iron-containing alcohol dehydrogenase [Alterisphingorhabdus coralli]|uniref:Alcohol dehydrogenase 2 n=1 Tax=Alterisphingorhabdus coralli TaxID=3071408 RepID=A0AA97F912_9SPHN|nr:iron-containing alcohol dehydrogenase [Parasphingorhabdus sp. SCSIO 66989]WOE76376.1 iron-containing alcohol dehydrogenase [Parasphingorhabdus sp. SCSIO 66989]
MTDNFLFQTVPHCVFGEGAVAELAAHLKGEGLTRIAVVTDKGLVATGVVATVGAALRSAGLEPLVFDSIVADPPEEIVITMAEAVRDFGADAVVGLGGGSPMDSAKVIAVLAGPKPQPLAEMYGVGNVTAPRLPLYMVPTTAGTGSEVTPIAILTTGETTKAGIVSPRLYADGAFLDPALTIGLPAHITASTGLDAMVHAIESYTGRLKKNPMSDMLAKEALRLLTGNLVRACHHGDDMVAREAMLRGSMIAGQAFANSPVGAVHALAYPLGGIFHVPHGLSNALVMPHVLRFNLDAAAPLYAELADALHLNAPDGEIAKAEAFIGYLEQLSIDSGAPQRLRDIDIPEDSLDRLADDAMLQERLLINNPREMTRDAAREVYDAAW